MYLCIQIELNKLLNMDKNKQIATNNANFKKCLKRHNCTIKELANIYGVSITAVSHWFDGDMSFTKVQSIAEYLGITLDELACGGETEQQQGDIITIQGRKYKVIPIED